MKRLKVSLLFLFTALCVYSAELRTWRAMGGFTVQARFIEYVDGTVKLQRHNGEMIEVRLERLTPADRLEVQRLAGEGARGSLPAGQFEVPTGRRELTWSNLNLGDHWPDGMTEREKNALLGLGRGWQHAETRFFLLHYQQIGFARTVARQADFFYQYIAADLPGLHDRRGDQKSSIVVVRNAREWQQFIENAGVAPEWSAAYVHGHVMYLQDTGRSQTNTHVLAHEMSHLVLNRFFARPPPLWLNEGLAEWYGHIAWKAFKGQNVNPRREVGRLRNPMPLSELLSARGYPERREDIPRFYQTSHHLVGFLMLEKDNQAFARFLRRVTVDGVDVMTAIEAEYGYRNVQELETAFRRFVR